jgi:uncharacterized phage infection (PIP) family protein YhgE
MANIAAPSGRTLAENKEEILDKISEFRSQLLALESEGGNTVFRNQCEIQNFFRNIHAAYGIKILLELESQLDINNLTLAEIYAELSRLETGLKSDNPNSLLDTEAEVSPAIAALPSEESLVLQFISLQLIESIGRISPETLNRLDITQLTADFRRLCGNALRDANDEVVDPATELSGYALELYQYFELDLINKLGITHWQIMNRLKSAAPDALDAVKNLKAEGHEFDVIGINPQTQQLQLITSNDTAQPLPIEMALSNLRKFCSELGGKLPTVQQYKLLSISASEVILLDSEPNSRVANYGLDGRVFRNTAGPVDKFRIVLEI